MPVHVPAKTSLRTLSDWPFFQRFAPFHLSALKAGGSGTRASCSATPGAMQLKQILRTVHRRFERIVSNAFVGKRCPLQRHALLTALLLAN